MTATRNQAQAGRTPGSEPGNGLAIGDEVQAWHNGRLYHQGIITKTVPGLDLIWISDAVTGRPVLLDPEALEIVPAARPQAANPPAARPQAANPPAANPRASNPPAFNPPALNTQSRDAISAPVTPSAFPLFSHGS